MFNRTVLASADPVRFRSAKPFPWWNPEGFLTDEAFEDLVRTAPPAELFRARFGKSRAYGQQSHDTYRLKYREGLPLSPEWQAFIRALRDPEYRSFIARMLGTNKFDLVFQWQYTPRGCAVSPHCDAMGKLASHLFYLTTSNSWRKEWGGETLILDDKGTLSCNSAPALQEFAEVIPSENVGNRSLLFMRTNHSWHAVRELTQPEGVFRMLFTVIITRKRSLVTRLRSRLVGIGWSVRSRG